MTGIVCLIRLVQKSSSAKKEQQHEKKRAKSTKTHICLHVDRKNVRLTAYAEESSEMEDDVGETSLWQGTNKKKNHSLDFTLNISGLMMGILFFATHSLQAIFLFLSTIVQNSGKDFI